MRASAEAADILAVAYGENVRVAELEFSLKRVLQCRIQFSCGTVGAAYAYCFLDEQHGSCIEGPVFVHYIPEEVWCECELFVEVY